MDQSKKAFNWAEYYYAKSAKYIPLHKIKFNFVPLNLSPSFLLHALFEVSFRWHCHQWVKSSYQPWLCCHHFQSFWQNTQLPRCLLSYVYQGYWWIVGVTSQKGGVSLENFSQIEILYASNSTDIFIVITILWTCVWWDGWADMDQSKKFPSDLHTSVIYPMHSIQKVPQDIFSIFRQN